MNLVIQVILLIISISVLSWTVSIENWYGLLALPIIIIQCRKIIVTQTRMLNEFQELVKTIRYRDFSRRFCSRKAPPYIRIMHDGFNEICDVINAVNLEKEMQYQYLQKIIEMVDTGIISYHVDTGKVLWMNQALKNLLEIPTLINFNALQKRNEQLFKNLQSLDRERSIVVPITRENSRNKVLVAARTFTMQETKYRLLAFQNVNEALDEAESQAWQRLLNVMTHEIMNSVAPITSLSATLKNLLKKTKDKSAGVETIVEDFELGIDTIMRRSEGLLAFAETYRNLSKITELNISKIHVSSLFEHVSQLMLPLLTKKDIELDVILKDPFMSLEADVSLVEQIMINLILNAVEAVKESSAPLITMSASIDCNKRPVIKVIDNGIGISDEVIDKIFVPFFSTRKNGNGIGLSLCKQIMLLHRGSIQVQTILGEGSCFSLMF